MDENRTPTPAEAAQRAALAAKAAKASAKEGA